MRRAATLLTAAGVLLFGSAVIDDSDPAAFRRFVPRAPARGESVVAALGDFGTGGVAQYAVARQMCAVQSELRFEFVATTGDNIYDSGHPGDFDDAFFEPYSCLLRNEVQFRAALGNHDVATDDGAPELSEPEFGMPARFYSWRVGSMRFVTLDSTALGPEQLSWMMDTLRTAQRAPWTIVVLHHPVFSGGDGHGPTPGLDALLAPIFEANGVDLVLQGHDHVYSRAISSGVTYIVTGGGGASLYGCVEPLPEAVQSCAPEHHFLVLRGSPARLAVSAVTAGGGDIESVRVARNR